MKAIRIVNILTLLVTLAVNSAANALPINGQTTGEISDRYPVQFTPAGYVFSIWGLIYLLLIGFAVYQALPGQQKNPRLDKIGWWFSAANLFNAAWIFFWHYELFLPTVLLMLGLLASLLIIYQRLEIGLVRPGWTEKLLVDLPFSVYLGWISVATIANLAVFLFDLGWNGAPLGPEPWTVLVILVAMGLGVAMILRRRERAYPLVLVWAFIGIAVRQSDIQFVAFTAGAAAAALALLLLFHLVRGAPKLAA